MASDLFDANIAFQSAIARIPADRSDKNYTWSL